ncbi:MAG: ATP-binding protein [Bacteroidia bacterium]
MSKQETPKLIVPEWAHEIRRKYLSENVSQFVIHGNINDYVKVEENGEKRFMKVRDFVSHQLFKRRDTVIHYDRAAGLRFRDDTRFGGESKMRQEFVGTLNLLSDLSGGQRTNLSADPMQTFYQLDKYLDNTLNQNLLGYLIRHIEKRLGHGEVEIQSTKEEEDIVERFMRTSLSDILRTESPKTSEKGKLEARLEKLKEMVEKPRSVGLVVDYAETLIPMGEGSRMRERDQVALVFLQKWATEEVFLDADFSVVVFVENIAEINQQYVRNPYTHEIFVPYPDEEERLDFIEHFFDKQADSKQYFEMDSPALASNTAGLGLVSLNIVMSEAARNEIPFTNKELTQKKKEMIETESGGLLEFIKTKYSLKDVAGHKHAKKHLYEAAKAVQSGRQDVMPMGYLISGPVGTGKTFMIKCFAKDIGVPMVMLKNFRSQWQGVTEGNLQKVLKILKAMSPVAVMIDEADAYLGDRSSSGDSGVSSRVFSMIATFMSDSENRGKVIWFLVTARPDLLPVDFKRQGRAEEHIGLFYPETLAEKKELLTIMLNKTGLGYMDVEEFDEEFIEEMTVKSGADMEAALTRSKFKAAALGIDKVNFDIIAQVFNDFIPPTYPEAIELMNYAAVLESTSKELLPPRFRDISRQEVLEKVEELKLSVK